MSRCIQFCRFLTRKYICFVIAVYIVRAGTSRGGVRILYMWILSPEFGHTPQKKWNFFLEGSFGRILVCWIHFWSPFLLKKISLAGKKLTAFACLQLYYLEGLLAHSDVTCLFLSHCYTEGMSYIELCIVQVKMALGTGELVAIVYTDRSQVIVSLVCILRGDYCVVLVPLFCWADVWIPPFSMA